MKALNKLFVVAVFLFLGVSAFAWDLGLYGPATPIDERAERAEEVSDRSWFRIRNMALMKKRALVFKKT